jgi:beta-glucosidase
MVKPAIQFPETFLWGASTSAHQVDGGNHNQWSVWELENARSLAAQAEYQYGDLDSWERVKKLATKSQNYVSGRATDHRRHYQEDFDLVKKLGLNSFRFSIEWSRLEPEEGAWNIEAIEEYRRYFAALKARGITPIVTLFHFTLPVWFAEQGGFERRANVKYFERYVQKVMEELGREFAWIITINEPKVYAEMSYENGQWPPQGRSHWRSIRVLHNLIVAHNKAARLIHGMSSRHYVSMAYNVSYVYAGDDAKLSRLYAWWLDWRNNRYFLLRTMRGNDFVGLNYYFSERVYGYRVHNPNSMLSDLGWDMQPANLQYLLEDISERYGKSIVITENGLADGDDDKRQWWLAQTIQAMHKARKNGADVIGYLHWSLLDNFEWDKGFWPRFGLVAVDYATMKRKPRASAEAFARTIARLRKPI